MILRSCSFEKEVELALKDGHWPHGCVPELRAHVDSCRQCSDLVLVTETFYRARVQTAANSLPDSPDLLWWRAQLRRRYMATGAVARPVTIAQTFALSLNLLVAVFLVAWHYRHGLHWAAWWDLLPTRALQLLSSTSAKPDWNPVLLIPTLGAVAILSGIVLYLVSERS